MRRTRPLLALSILALLLVAAGCSAADDSTGAAAPEEPADRTGAHEADADGTDAGEREDAEAGGDAEPSGDSGIGAGDGSGGAPPPSPATPASRGAPGDRLIKEGTMVVEVPDGGFQQAFDRVVTAARSLGGDVVASTSSSTEAGGTAGSVTIRVPVDRYEDLLVGVGGVGEIRRRDITTKDVTAEFTDIESRLRHARAQERFYLGLLEEAEGVADAIAVQQQLDGIQSTIEQLQGRLNLLEDRTSYSTLTVELVEPGASPVLASAERPHLAGYLQTAQDAFITVVGSTLVVLVALTPLVLPAAVAGLGWRAARRSRAARVPAP